MSILVQFYSIVKLYQWQVGLFLLLLFLRGIGSIAAIFLLRQVLSDASFTLAIWWLVIISLTMLCDSFVHHVQYKLQVSLSLFLERSLYIHTLKHPHSFIEKHMELPSKIISCSTNLADIVLTWIQMFLFGFLSTIGSSILLYIRIPFKLSIVILWVPVLTCFLTTLIALRRHQGIKKLANKFAECKAVIYDRMRYHELISIYGSEMNEYRNMQRIQNEYSQLHHPVCRSYQLSLYISQCIMILVVCVPTMYFYYNSIYMSNSPVTVSADLFLLYSCLAFCCSQWYTFQKRIFTDWERLQDSKYLLKKLTKLKKDIFESIAIETNPELVIHTSTSPPQPLASVAIDKTGISNPADIVGSVDPPPQYALEFENVTFSYDSDRPPLFENLTLKIPIGQKVGLVGRSGSGKTSLLLLPLRLNSPLDPSAKPIVSGTIRLFGQDIQSLPPGTIHHMFAVMLQETQILYGTLRSNIMYGSTNAYTNNNNDDDDKKNESLLNNILETSVSTEIIKKLPHQLSTVVGGIRGAKLSGGEIQRIGIARTLYRMHQLPWPNGIVIMDEPTSALDVKIEETLQKQFINSFQGKTVLISAHRLHTLLNMDRVIILENGKIIEDGNPTHLLQNHGSIFGDLFRRSTKVQQSVA